MFVEFLSDRKTFRFRWYEEHGNSVLVIGISPGAEDCHVAINSVGDKGFGSVNSPAVSVFDCRGAYPGNVGPSVGFGYTDRENRLPGQNAGHPFRELLVAT